MKLNYSEPKIYTGGIDIYNWSKLSKKEQQNALDKNWYVYFSFRNPKTNKLVRQSNIKAGANKYKTKRDRLRFLKTIQRNLIILLESGFSPYEDNSLLEQKFLGNSNEPKLIKEDLKQKPIEIQGMSIDEAIKLVLNLKSKTYKRTSFPGFKSNVERFEKWLYKNDFKDKKVSEIEKKTVIKYLNEVLVNTSARTRNNTRTDCMSSDKVELFG